MTETAIRVEGLVKKLGSGDPETAQAAAVAIGLGSAGPGLVPASHTAFVDDLSSAVWVAVGARWRPGVAVLPARRPARSKGVR